MAGEGVAWQEVRCNRTRDGEACGNLIGYTAIGDGYVALWCRKCKCWTVIGTAGWLPDKLPAFKRVELEVVK